MSCYFISNYKGKYLKKSLISCTSIKWKHINGGRNRNRTDIEGFAILCMTILPSGLFVRYVACPCVVVQRLLGAHVRMYIPRLVSRTTSNDPAPFSTITMRYVACPCVVHSSSRGTVGDVVIQKNLDNHILWVRRDGKKSC